MEPVNSIKPSVYLPFDVLPESKSWHVGKVYRVKLVVRQTNLTEDGASFDVIDGSPLESAEAKKTYLMS